MGSFGLMSFLTELLGVFLFKKVVTANNFVTNIYNPLMSKDHKHPKNDIFPYKASVAHLTKQHDHFGKEQENVGKAT